MNKDLLHDNWLNGVSVVLGYVWLMSGINKLLNGRFVADFAKNADEFLSPDAYGWYQYLLNNFILPHNIIFANMIMWGEVLLGAALIGGGAAIWFYHKRWLHLLLAWASLGSLLLILNIALSQGGLLPWFSPEEPYEESVGLDTVILLLSLLLAMANFSEAGKENRKGT